MADLRKGITKKRKEILSIADDEQKLAKKRMRADIKRAKTVPAKEKAIKRLKKREGASEKTKDEVTRAIIDRGLGWGKAPVSREAYDKDRANPKWAIDQDKYLFQPYQGTTTRKKLVERGIFKKARGGKLGIDNAGQKLVQKLYSKGGKV